MTVETLVGILQGIIQEGKGSYNIVYDDSDYGECDVENIKCEDDEKQVVIR